MKRVNKICLLAVIVGLVCGTALADTIYVREGANGDGTSWANAYGILQDALDDANNNPDVNQIWVAEGTYYPTYDYGLGIGDRGRHFRLINGVCLYGGFPDTGEPNMEDRDPSMYETILSGDINTPDDNSDNSYHIFYHPEGTNLNSTTVLDGFIITSGNANGPSPHYDGGGMYNRGNNPTVTNCTFSDNTASYGGGMFNYDSGPTVINCTFIGNSAGGEGGGMSIISSIYPGSNLTVTNCAFIGNSAGEGGGMSNGSYNLTVTNCTFIGNTAGNGGGMSNYRYWFVANCTFIGNTAEYHYGGGMYILEGGGFIYNCTFSGNSADYGGAIYTHCIFYPGVSFVINCILWDDTQDEISFGGGCPSPEVTYSDVQGGWWGDSNIDTDPMFADVDANDFHLKSQAGRWDADSQSWVVDSNTSPCIDAGDWATPVGSEPFPNGGRVNMGAYGGTVEASKSYFGTEPCEIIVAGDINGDCKVDFIDFAIMALHWQQDEN